MSTLKISGSLDSFGKWQKTGRQEISDRLGNRSFSSMPLDDRFEIAVFGVTENQQKHVLAAIESLGVQISASNLVEEK